MVSGENQGKGMTAGLRAHGCCGAENSTGAEGVKEVITWMLSSPRKTKFRMEREAEGQES